MNKVTGVIAFPSHGRDILIERQKVSSLEIDLGDGEWCIGLDPASKYTGIALMDASGQRLVLLDVRRDTLLPKEAYYDDLFYLLKRLVHGKKVKMVVNEKPFTKGYSRASDVLIALRGKIELWMREIPELQFAQYRQIYPQSWKSQVIDKKKGKNRFNAKGAVAEDLVEQFPVLERYYNCVASGDYDSFDALGVLIGFKRKNYTSSGAEIINGMDVPRHNSLVAYEWVPVEELKEGYARGVFGKFFDVFQPRFLVYNTDYKFAENVKLATSNYKCAYTMLPQDQLQQLQWKFGIDITEPGHQLIMFVFRKGQFTPNALEWVREKFAMNEDMGEL